MVRTLIVKPLAAGTLETTMLGSHPFLALTALASHCPTALVALPLATLLRLLRAPNLIFTASAKYVKGILAEHLACWSSFLLAI